MDSITDLCDVDVLLDELAADNLVRLLAAVAVQQGVVLLVDGRLLLLVPAPFQICNNFLLRPLRRSKFMYIIRIMSWQPVIPIRTGLKADPGSRMGKKSGSGSGIILLRA
jgi:hypothetical protein